MASGNIKGITIQFRGDTSQLDKSLRKIKSETKSIDSELKSVNKALKFNPTSVELWRQKQQLLTEKVEKTKETLDALKQAQKQMDADGVEKNSEEYRKLQRQIIETESKLKNFTSQLRAVGNVKLRAVSEQFKAVGNKLTTVGNSLKGVSKAGAAVLAMFGATAYKAGSWSDDINTLSKQYGISTNDLQKYAASAELVDVSVEAIAKSQTKLKRNMLGALDGTNEQAQYFEQLGINITNADGSLRDANEVFDEVIGALGSMTNETERDAIAMALMGKSANELNPLIEDGGETYKKTAELFEKYNLDFLDQKTLDQANEFKDSLDTIKALGGIAFQQLGAQLAGILAPAMEKLVQWTGQFVQWLSNLSPEVLTIIGIVAGVAAVLAPVVLGLGKLAFAISSIINLISVIAPALATFASSFGLPLLAIGAVVAAGVFLYKNWDKIKAKATELAARVVAKWNEIKTKVINYVTSLKEGIASRWESIKTKVSDTVESIKTKLSNGWASIRDHASSMWQTIKDKITAPFEAAKEKVSAIVDKIKSFFPLPIAKIFEGLKLPKINVSAGEKPWGIGGKGVKPSITMDWVNWYGRGGIFDAPQIIGIGDSKGGEAAVPLDPLWDRFDRLERASGGNTVNINVTVNGADDPEQWGRRLVKQMNLELRAQ